MALTVAAFFVDWNTLAKCHGQGTKYGWHAVVANSITGRARSTVGMKEASTKVAGPFYRGLFSHGSQ